MTNRNSFSNPEGRQQSSYSAAENQVLRDEINSRPVTEDELAYRDGYIQGRNEEQVEQVEAGPRAREANSVGAGAIIGVLMATVAGLVLAMLYLTPRQQTVVEPTGTQVAPAVAPASSQPTSPVPNSAAPITPAQPQVGTAQPTSPVPNQVTVIQPVQEVPVAQPQPQVVQPQVSQPQVTQPQVQPQVTQPLQPSVTTQPNVATDSQGQPLAPTSPTDPYQSPQPNVITPPGSFGQP